MSKQMTREEAVQAILDAVTELGRWSVPNDVEEAIAILAPEPRTEPPMKYDLADDAKGWGANSADVWVLTTGAVIRSRWGITYTNWLPESALPMPKGGA